MDEFAGGDRVGAARIIDIADEKASRVVSNLRLEVNQAAARAGGTRAATGGGTLADRGGRALIAGLVLRRWRRSMP